MSSIPTISMLLVVLVAVGACCLNRSQGAEPPAAGSIQDPFAGRTVLDRNFGFHLIQARADNAPRVGEPAPDFELQTADGQRTVKLSDFRGRRPVVLIFGSST